MNPVMLAVMTAFSMASGQLLFKIGSEKWQGTTVVEWALSFLKNPYLVTAVALYAFTILVWIYVLKHLPLSIAYPITALSYIIVPIFSFLLFQEKISIHTAIGSVAIVAGIAIIHLNGG